jgi:signal transduction histidine kinase
MARPRPRTVRSDLTVLVFASVIPVLIFAIIMVLLVEEQHRASLERSLRDTARALSVSVDLELTSSLSTLNALATSEHLDTGDLRAFYQQAQRVLVVHETWKTISLLDLSGQQVLNLLRPLGAPLPPSGNLEVVRRTLDTGQPAVSDIFVGPVFKAPIVGITVPVMRGGVMKYVMGAGLDVGSLNHLLSEGKRPADWIATIIDRKGLVVARTRGIEQLVATPATPEFVAQSRQAEEGSFRDVTKDGIPVYAAYSRSRLSGWTVSLGAPATAVEAPLRAAWWAITGSGIGFLLLAGGLAMGFGRRITGAIESLSVSVRAIGQGQILAGSGGSRISEVEVVQGEIADAARALADAVAARVKTEEERARYAERLRILHDIDQGIIAAQAPAEIAEAALRGLRGLLAVPRVIVNLFDLPGAEAEWLAAAGRRRIRLGPGVRFPLALMGDVERLRRGEPQVVDVTALPPSPDAEALLASDVRVYMVVPMIAAGDLIGALSFGGPSGEFAPEQVGIAQEVAAQMAIAIAQARLYERVKHEAEVLERRVRERTAELEAAQADLVRAERLAILGQLAGGVSHELRNPLGVIKNSVYFLRMVVPEEERVRKHLNILEREVETATRIITSLLDFAQLRAPAATLVDLNALVQQQLERTPAPAGIATRLELAPELPPVMVDPEHIRLVLGNLLLNAIQAMSDGGTLTLRTAAAAPGVSLMIADTGVGIPSENLDKIFEPLFTTKAKGIGLGLSLAKRLVESNRGSIGVESLPGQGTRFELRFTGA